MYGITVLESNGSDGIPVLSLEGCIRRRGERVRVDWSLYIAHLLTERAATFYEIFNVLSHIQPMVSQCDKLLHSLIDSMVTHSGIMNFGYQFSYVRGDLKLARRLRIELVLSKGV